MYRHRSLDRIPFSCAHADTIALFILLDNHLDYPPHGDAFNELTTALRAIARRFVLAKASMQFIWLTSKYKGRDLPQEAKMIFEEFERVSWTEEDRKTVSSMFPNMSLSVGQGRDAEMDRFLEKWCHFNFEDRGGNWQQERDKEMREEKERNERRTEKGKDVTRGWGGLE